MGDGLSFRSKPDLRQRQKEEQKIRERYPEKTGKI